MIEESYYNTYLRFKYPHISLKSHTSSFHHIIIWPHFIKQSYIHIGRNHILTLSSIIFKAWYNHISSIQRLILYPQFKKELDILSKNHTFHRNLRQNLENALQYRFKKGTIQNNHEIKRIENLALSHKNQDAENGFITRRFVHFYTELSRYAYTTLLINSNTMKELCCTHISSKNHILPIFHHAAWSSQT